MSTQSRAITFSNPLGWFAAGLATALVTVAVAAGLILAGGTPATPSGGPSDAAGPASVLDAGYRLQRAGEIGAGVNASSGGVLGLNDHRRGEIGAADVNASSGGVLGLNDHRRGEIGAGH